MSFGTKDTEQLLFGLLDYLSLFLVLGISVLIGLCSLKFKKDNSAEEYLFGYRKLHVIPVALSIMATKHSSISVVSFPTEVYLYGSDMFYRLLSNILSTIISAYLFLPVFHNLKISTVYQYLDRRFNGTVRGVCSVLFTLNVILTMPVVMSVCSLTISKVCGINFNISVIIFGVITTFYTTIGGIKAVVWADSLQAVFMFVGTITLAVKGTADAGGFNTVWNKNYDAGRIVPPRYSMDLTEHYSVWSWIIGHMSLVVVSISLSQGAVQRILSIPTLQGAKRSFILAGVSSLLYTVVNIYIGMLIITMFVDCDPLKSGKVIGRDQMTSLYVMKTLSSSPGIPGIIIAGIVSAALSTVSTQINSLAAVVLYDYYKPYINRNISEDRETMFLKITVVILGFIITGFTFIIKNFGTGTQVYHSFLGCANGPVLAIFIIGFFLPFVKSKPTIFGSLFGFSLLVWMSIGMNMSVAAGTFRYKTKEIFTHGCENNVTISNSTNTQREVFMLYRISATWYTPIGCVTTLIVAGVLNIFMEKNDVSKMDKGLFSSIVHRFISQKRDDIPDTELSLLKPAKENENINNN